MVAIVPSIYSPFDGVSDPERAEFIAELGDTDDIVKGPPREVVQVLGAEAAIAWARERADIVLITLDGRWEPSSSFSAGAKPGWIAGIHEAPLAPWPGIGRIDPPAEGCYEPPDEDAVAPIEAAVRRLREMPGVEVDDGRVIIKWESSQEPSYPKEPPDTPGLRATFKWEDEAEDGEDIGPLIVSDPSRGVVVWEPEDWIRLSEARNSPNRRAGRSGSTVRRTISRRRGERLVLGRPSGPMRSGFEGHSRTLAQAVVVSAAAGADDGSDGRHPFPSARLDGVAASERRRWAR
jgi:hypothetical protein